MLNEIKHDEEGVNVKTALCVGFAAFLRCGEFTWNTWSPDSHCFLLSHQHIAFHPTSVTLTLPASKTDQFHTGTEIYLAYSPHSSLCPVSALRALFTCFPKPPQSPLFTRPYGQPFSKSFFVIKMRELLLNTGISTIGYSGHSLRKGAAVTANRNGIPKHDIKLLGWWKSDVVDVYINECQKPDHIKKTPPSQLMTPLFYSSLISLASFDGLAELLVPSFISHNRRLACRDLQRDIAHLKKKSCGDSPNTFFTYDHESFTVQ